MPDFLLELEARDKGLWPVAGVDEAGRGPLAGPVVAASVILDPERIPAGLNDSKKLSAKGREKLFHTILETALGLGVASVSAEHIDETNILRASLEAMRRAVSAMSVAPRLVLTDGRDVPPGLPCQGRAVIGGDGISQSVAAASIIAKVLRDQMMSQAGLWHHGYGFEKHAGYGTAQHRHAITLIGAVPRMHRMTFAPLKGG